MKAVGQIVAIALGMVVLSTGWALGCSVVVIREPAKVSRSVLVSLSYQDTPVKNVELSVLEKSTGKLVQKVTTDDRGAAHIDGLAAGRYTITSAVSDDEIVATGADGTTNLKLSATVERVPVILAEVKGVVVDITGAVIPRAVIVVERLDQSHSPVAAGQSDESGRVALKAAPGLYRLRVASPGFATAVLPVRVVNDGWASFRLQLRVESCPAGAPDSEVNISSE